MKLCHFIIDLAGKAILHPEKYLQPGHNGPYHDPETPVRISGHWLITFARCYEWTREMRFKNKVAELAAYLCSEDSRPYGYSFHHRNKPGKDRCNGLIGQAWTFEALAEASAVLKDDSLGQLAEGVFFQHPFDYRFGLWRCLEIDGKVLEFDVTFNHQLWFAACSSLIQSTRRDEIEKRIARFLDCLKTNMTVTGDGLIYHPIEHLLKSHVEGRQSGATLKKRGFSRLLRFVRSSKHSERRKSNDKTEAEMQTRLVFKSIGYHCFNMYAFALLKGTIPNHPFWNSNTLASMADYMLTDEYKDGVESNPFGYPYNPPGFEVPYALSTFKRIPKGEMSRTCSWWISDQLRRCYNGQTKLMDRNTEDPLTHTARVYELVRLNDSLCHEIAI